MREYRIVCTVGVLGLPSKVRRAALLELNRMIGEPQPDYFASVANGQVYVSETRRGTLTLMLPEEY